MNIKPRRGRREAGTVRTWAEKYGVGDRITNAIPGNINLLKKVLDCPVHIGQLGETAGRCCNPGPYYPIGLIELHQELLEDHIPKDEITRTFIHEVGHLIDCHERGRSDHSKAWKKVMARLGEPDEDSHHDLPIGVKTTLHCPKCKNSQGTRLPKKAIAEKVSHKRLCSFCGDCRVVTLDEAISYYQKYTMNFDKWPQSLKVKLSPTKARFAAKRKVDK